MILTPCRSPTPVAAAVEFAPGVGADVDQPVVKELVTAFNEAEARLHKSLLTSHMMLVATRMLPQLKPGAYSLLDLPVSSLSGEQHKKAEREWL